MKLPTRRWYIRALAIWSHGTRKRPRADRRTAFTGRNELLGLAAIECDPPEGVRALLDRHDDDLAVAQPAAGCPFVGDARQLDPVPLAGTHVDRPEVLQPEPVTAEQNAPTVRRHRGIPIADLSTVQRFLLGDDIVTTGRQPKSREAERFFDVSDQQTTAVRSHREVLNRRRIGADDLHLRNRESVTALGNVCGLDLGRSAANVKVGTGAVRKPPTYGHALATAASAYLLRLASPARTLRSFRN